MDRWQRFQRTFLDIDQILAIVPDLVRIGIPNTLLLSAIAVLIGLVLGLALALLLLARSQVLRWPARAYVDVFRGLPVVLTIYLIGQGLPIAGIRPFGQNSYAYAALALGLIEGAYMSEIFRSGIQSVERGQMEAARALGLSYLKAMALVVVPQGVRRVLPALTGQFIHVIKGSSLVYLLGLLPEQREIFSIASDAAHIQATLSPLVAGGIAYLILTVPMTYAVNAFDRRVRQQMPGPGDAAARITGAARV
ncbi:MAG: amino acid ABC transporter permease [Alphaproteobacteria bacterium]|nr:amino acid ABC transporter permease [Alphaproteobacteria bacterium]